MDSYRFTTKVSDKGIIQVPLHLPLHDKEVEIIIRAKPKMDKEKMKAMDFVAKWAGFISNQDIEKSKFDYLSDKYK